MSNGTSEQAPIPVIVHLSGARRGTTQRLHGDSLSIGTAPEVDVHVAHEPSVASRHATLVRHDDTYQLLTEPERPVWVNGQPAVQQLLASGDVLEIGRDGPLLRFRLYPPGSAAFKSPAEAFSDCIACARHSSRNPVGRAAAFLAGTPRELATQTSRSFRALLTAALLLLMILIGLLARGYVRLEQRLQQEEIRVQGIGELLQETEQNLTPEEFARISESLSTTLQRVEALEARTAAPARVVAAATQSIVFLQGAYGFIEPTGHRPLRFAGIDAEGLPLRDGRGAPIVGLGGGGPVVEAFFTGTGFVATPDGLIVTNRHVALPWDYDDGAQLIRAQGFRPVMWRFIGYLPGDAESFDVDLVVASDIADLAVLRCQAVRTSVPDLQLAGLPPAAGAEVIVLGYPAGIRALLARADPNFVKALSDRPETDFWSLVAQLAAAGHVAPLASRGIVAQVSPAAVVYDAETTRGGSGGPVLDLSGDVVAVTSAIVPEFGGSNLGVPATRVREILARARASDLLLFRVR